MYCERCLWKEMKVYEVSSSKASGISEGVSKSPEHVHVRNTAHKESNLRISVCEYDAPTTILESGPLDGTFLGLLGLLRQKGDVFLLKKVNRGLR